MVRKLYRSLPRALAAAGAVLLSLAAVPAARAQLVAEGPTPNLFLIYTGDVIGYIDPCG